MKKYNLKIVKNRMYYFGFSLTVLLVCLIASIVNVVSGNGFFNLDVDFSGGMTMTIDIGQEFDNQDIEKIVTEITSQQAPQVQKVVNTNQVNIKIKSIDTDVRQELIDTLAEKYGFDPVDVNFSDVSPTISQEMQTTAIMAMVVAWVAILLYVSIRFRDIRFGASSIIALIHDALIVVGVYALLRIPLSYSFIAVVLTIIGYSINSTIVTFDRIRENRALLKRVSAEELIDNSINQTLHRSIYTSLTTLISVLFLYIIGVPSIKEFTLPIIIGIIFGAYSSVFMAGSILYMMMKTNSKEQSSR